MEIDFKEAVRGRGFWKFNSSLLLDEIYIDKVKKEINNVTNEYTTNQGDDLDLSISKQMLLKMIKLRIHGVTIPYCARKKKQTLEK